MRDLKKKIVSSTVARVASLTLSLLTFSVSAHKLGPDGGGTVAAVRTWATLFMTVGFLSLGQVAVHYATERRGTAWLGDALGSLLALTGIISLIGWIVAGALFTLTDGRAFGKPSEGLTASIMAIGMLNLPFLIWEHYGSGLLTALDKVSLYNRGQLVGRAIGFFVVMILVFWLRTGVLGVLIALIVSQMLTAGGGILYLVREARTQSPIRARRQTVRRLLKGGIQLHLNAIGAYMLTYTDILVVSHYRGPVETGYYNIAFQISSILIVMTMGAVSILTSMVAQSGPDEAWPIHRATIRKVMIAVTALTIFCAVFAPLLILALGGVKFAPSVGVFRLICINVICVSFSLLMGPQWIGRGLFMQMAVLALIAGALNFGMNLLLVPKYGMMGSAWATVVSGLASASINLGFYRWVNRRNATTLNAVAA